MRRLVYVVRQETLTEQASGFGQRVQLLLRILPLALGADWTCELLSPFPVGERSEFPGWKCVSGVGSAPCPNSLYSLWRRRMAPVWSRLGITNSSDWAEFGSVLLGIDPLQLSSLREGLSRHPPDIVLLSRCDLIPALPAFLPSKIVVDTNDLLANLFKTYQPRGKLLACLGVNLQDFVSRLEDIEQKFYRYHRAIAISPADGASLKSKGCTNVLVESQCLLPPPAPTRRSSHTCTVRVGYFGGTHQGSVASARLFMDVAERMIGDNLYQFEIAGAVSELMGGGGCNLHKRGRLASMADFLAEMDVIVLLSAGETGTSVKFQEACFSGVPVIANFEAVRMNGLSSQKDYTLVAGVGEAAASLREGGWRGRFLDLKSLDSFRGAAVARRWRALIHD
jgi:hypothetical protein